MKINKILAAGVAATLAVTSLSAVVGAETHTQSYEIYTTKANASKTITIQAEVNKDIASHLKQNDMQAVVLSNIATGFANVNVDSITMTVSGYQTAAASAITTKEFKFKKDDKSTGATKDKWRIVVLDKKTPVYHDGEFASFYFDTITSLKIDVTVKGETISSGTYDSWGSDSYLKIGQIDYYSVNQQTAACDKLIDSYGVLGTGADAVDDKNAVIAAAAKETTASVEAATVAEQFAQDDKTVDGIAPKGKKFAAAGKGLLIGTPVKKETARLAGSEIIETQALYTSTTAFASVYKTADWATPNAAITAVTAKGTASATAPIVIGSDIYTSGVIYSVTGATADAPQLVYAPTAITDANTTALAKATDVTTLAKLQTYLPGAKVIVAYSADFNALPIMIEVDKTKSEKITADADSTGENAALVATNANQPATAVIIDKNGNYILTNNPIYGQAFTQFAYDETANSVAPLLSYAFARGGWYQTKAAYGDTQDEQKYKPDRTTTKLNAWLPCTTEAAIAGVRTTEDHEGKTTITRQDVDVLSSTNDYHSTTGGNFVGNWAGGDKEPDNQTYEEEMIKGTRPLGFAGLASQVANFFNKQDNGKITFTFTSQAAAGATSAWSMGIPSTEVGLIGSGAGSVTANFALFFNYNTTGGMMLSKAKADLTKGTVEFDISDYLAQSGTLTMATLHDIYYGLNVGYKYNDWTNVYGMYVSKVELSYDDAPAADADAAAAADDDATVADDDDAAAVVDADDDDDDDDTALIEDDDDDDDDDATIIADDDDDDTDDDDIAAVITDDDEDDTAAAGTVDVVTPAAQDSNPATGVGLAVIPAIVAAAAMAISKKRK